MISVVTCTYRREPRFDWLADGIAAQEPLIPFEWIVVDGWLWKPDAQARREALARAVAGRFPVRHVAPKPTRWQGPARYTASDFFALCNARNTAAIIAAGDHLAFVDDCCLLDPAWLKHHAQWAASGLGVAGAYCHYRSAQIVHGQAVPGNEPPLVDPRRATMPEPGPAPIGWAYGLNNSVPLSVVLAVNGWDEMYDGQAGSEDCDFHVRAARAGCQYIFDPGCVVNQVESYIEASAAPQVVHTQVAPHVPKRAILRADGIEHFCNEALIERLLWDDKERTQPLATWVDVRKLRDAYSASGAMPDAALGPNTYWLDSEPLTEMT